MRFFIHVTCGDLTYDDRLGSEFADLAAAARAAERVARDLAADSQREGRRPAAGCRVDVTDAAGVVKVRLPIAGPAAEVRPERCRALYQAVPHAYLMLSTDLIIIDANRAYLAATLTDAEAIRGRPLFEVFPDNPGDPDATGVRNLSASLERLLREKVVDAMARQRYDIRRRDGTWERRHWEPVNIPVLDDNGEVDFIVHHTRDVTRLASTAAAV